MAKVALITGGASGMGLAVATTLAKRGDWHVHLIDLNAERGNEAAKTLGHNVKFHESDVKNYSSLASIFDSIFTAEGRLDFVFANAGVVERWNFYGEHPAGGPPPEPDLLTADINLKSVVTTSYLAQHYFRQSPGKTDKSLVMTASCGGLYPTTFCPIYTATKHGVIGLTRAIAKHYYLHDGIRVNAICPGTVRTNLLDAQGWSGFPEEHMTPIEKIVEVVLMLVDGGDMIDAKGVKIAGDKALGLAVEVNRRNHYFREMPEYCDESMRLIMTKYSDIDETTALNG